MVPQVLIIVSYYDRRDPQPLRRLLASMEEIAAGHSFDACVVVNRDTPDRLELADLRLPVKIVERENVGMNIGAWDHGWRTFPEYSAYLFLQDECYAVRSGWLAAFASKADEDGIGLVGESLNEKWAQPWAELRRRWAWHQMPEHLIDGRPAGRVDVYLDFMRRNRIPAGTDGSHLRSLVWYAKRSVLERIDGFPIGRNYGECIAAEIGVSKRVQALRLRVVQAAEQPFSYIRHREWVQEGNGHQFVHRRLS